MKTNNETNVRTRKITINIPVSILGEIEETQDGCKFNIEIPVSDSLRLPTQEMFKSLEQVGFTGNECERLIGAMMEACDHEQCMIALGQYVK